MNMQYQWEGEERFTDISQNESLEAQSGTILACTRMVQSMMRDSPFAYCVEQSWIIPLTRVPHATMNWNLLLIG